MTTHPEGLPESSIAQTTQFTGEALDSAAARRELTDAQRSRIALAQRFMAREGWEPYWMVYAEVPEFVPVFDAHMLRTWLEANAVAIDRRVVQLVLDKHWRTWTEHVSGIGFVTPIEVPGKGIGFLRILDHEFKVTSARQSDRAVRDLAADVVGKYLRGELRVRDVSALRRALELRQVPIEAGVAADRQHALSNLDWYASRLVHLFENAAWNADLTNHPHIKNAPDFLGD